PGWYLPTARTSRAGWGPRSDFSASRSCISLRCSQCSLSTGGWPHEPASGRRTAEAPAREGPAHGLAARCLRHPSVPDHRREDRAPQMTALASRNARTATRMAVLAFAMLGLAFASVPLYRAFCELTGFDGTPLRAEKAPGAVAGQIGVRFDANINAGLPWKFEPVQETVRIAPGARTQIFYRATNL